MASLDEILARPIRWKNWQTDADLLAFLSDLQANILKGHGRDHTANIFLSFGSLSQEAIKTLLTKLSYLVTPALEQLRSAEAFKATNVSGGRIICAFLSRHGYAKLGADDAATPVDLAFRGGMRARGRLPNMRFDGIPVDFPGINDPLPNAWDPGGPWAPANPEPDAMLLVADDNPVLVDKDILAIQHVLNGTGCRVLGIDKGLAQRRVQAGGNPKGEGLEHFGYVDGRSQPLFLEEDLDREAQAHWSARFNPSQFIVADPARCNDVAAGSYFVYRKLEQNVKHFKEQEDALESMLPGIMTERAGALVVGRFEDGTPTVTGMVPQFGNPVNDFNYDTDDGNDDPAKAVCPFKAHIRKTNPRTRDDERERSRIMARRGITYGARQPRPPGSDFPEADRPTKDVGLLFMAYMANIHEQFEFTQCAWANNADFQHPSTGIDAVIGQQPHPDPALNEWHDALSNQTANFNFETSISLKGGDYFFAPSISFLQRG